MKKVMMTSIILLITAFYSISIYSATVYVYGKGGVVDLPSGARCYCPITEPVVCAIIKEGASGVPDYPDVLTHYDEVGQPLDTVNVRRAGELPNGQPTWWVQPEGPQIQKLIDKNTNNDVIMRKREE